MSNVMTSKSDLLELLRKARLDAMNAQAKVNDVINLIAGMDLPDVERVKCKWCGTPFRGARSLAEHVYNSHQGPVPEHYLAAERLAGIDTLS